MSATDDAFYEQDFVRASCLVTIQLAGDVDAKVQPQIDAHDAAVAKMDALIAGGLVPPVDLAEHTNDLMMAERAGYAAALQEAEDALALPPEVQEALGINVARMELQKARMEEWIAAFDAVWPEGS